MPRIAVDARMIDHSGIGTYLRALLPRLVAGNPDLDFALLGDVRVLAAEAWTAAPNCAIVPCDAPIYSIREQLRVPLAAGDVDLFWAPHYTIPIGYRGRLLVTVHDLCHLALPHLFGGAHRRLYARMMFAAVRHRATAVITVSEFTRREFEDRVGAPRQPVTVIPNGVDTAWFDVAAGERPEPGPYIVAVGNVKPHKNLGALVRAFARLVDHIPHRLIIVGRDEGFRTGDGETPRLAAALGDRVRFTGHVPLDELRRMVAHAELLVLPSLYEGFGLPALEAMACGCPVAVSNAASLPEVCGDAAAYFDPTRPDEIAAVIVSLLVDPGRRAELRRRGVERARRFTWEAAAQRTAEVIRMGIAAAPKGGVRR